MAIDPPCGDGVNRPPPPASVLSCAPTFGSVVTISEAARRTAGSCLTMVRLDEESGCVVASPGMTETDSSGTRQATDLTVTWPLHGVQIAVTRTFDTSFSLQIIRSVHAVPVDRNGCAARNDALLLPKHVPDPANVRFADGLPRTDPARQMSVCWYVDNRLVASGLLGSKDADAVLRGAQEVADLFDPYTGGPCDPVDRTNGVELITEYADGSTGHAVLHAARCGGRSHASPAGQYVANVGKLAGMPLTLGYRPGD
jgi:hypothetical protein